jgi:hypothetical protein
MGKATPAVSSLTSAVPEIATAGGTTAATAAPVAAGAGVTPAVTAATTPAIAQGGSGLFGSLAQVGQTLVEGLQNITQSLAGNTPSELAGPTASGAPLLSAQTPFQNLLGGLSQGATSGLFGNPQAGTAAMAGRGLGGLLQRGMQGQPQQAEPAQIYPRPPWQRYV